jgi:hypothetical protein
MSEKYAFASEDQNWCTHPNAHFAQYVWDLILGRTVEKFSCPDCSKTWTSPTE